MEGGGGGIKGEQRVFGFIIPIRIYGNLFNEIPAIQLIS
jgi:hypothetical protein